MFRPRAPHWPLTLLGAALIFLFPHPSSAQGYVPATGGFSAEIRVWTSGPDARAEVVLTFPTTGFRVSDWGRVKRVGNEFTADARVERYTEGSGQAVTVRENTFDLGALAPGTYTFTFMSYGVALASREFDPSLVAEHWEQATLPRSLIGFRVITSEGGFKTARVELYLPDTGYRVKDWGHVSRSGNDFVVDISVERWTGEAERRTTVAAQDYPLGPLAPGSYAVVVRMYGAVVATQPFNVTESPDSAPKLLTEGSTERAIALDSVTWIRLFPLATTHNFSADGRARIMLLATGVEPAGGDPSAVTARAEDAGGKVYPLAVEYVGRVPDFGWITQIVVRPPDELMNAGDVRVSVGVGGRVSNRALVTFK